MIDFTNNSIELTKFMKKLINLIELTISVIDIPLKSVNSVTIRLIFGSVEMGVLCCFFFFWFFWVVCVLIVKQMCCAP